MQQILILGGGAAGLAAALAAAQSAPAAQVTVLDATRRWAKSCLATGNGRCNLDNTGIAPELYFTADPAALRPLLARWMPPRRWRGSERWAFTPAPMRPGGCTRTPIRRQTCWPCWSTTLRSTSCSCAPAAPSDPEPEPGRLRRAVRRQRAGTETLRADAVICAMGGDAGPQFGTDGFGTRFAAQCGGRMEPLYPCLTALQCAKPRKALAGIRAKAAAIPAGRCPCACLRERRGTVHRLRPFRHLHHAAVRPAGPGPRPQGSCCGAGPLPGSGRNRACQPVCGPRRPDGRGQRR